MPLGEFELIARYFAHQPARADVPLGIGDDAAVLEVPADRRLVVAIDTVVEGVHFPVGTDAADIGYRALAVNLSDLAAMGAVPSWFTLSLSIPHSEESWVREFASGMFELARRYDLALVGGDTVKGPLVVTIQVAGTVEQDRWLTRAGARPGDLVFVSGVPGEAAGGLATLQRAFAETDAVRRLRQRFLRPTARVELGRALRSVASAAMDISDGLLSDLDKLCSASRCGATLDVERLPKSADLDATFDEASCWRYALSGGDDYELLFTIPPQLLSCIATLSVPCTQIGTITAAPGVVCRRDQRPFVVDQRGYDHFGMERPS